MAEKEKDFEDEKEIPRGKRKKQRKKFLSELRDETRDSISAILFLVLSLIFLLAELNKAGALGSWFYKIFSSLLGWGYSLIPLLFFMLAISFARSIHHQFRGHKISGAIIFLASTLAFVEMLYPEKGGVVGRLLAKPLVSLFDIYASFIVVIALSVVSFLMIFDIHLSFGAFRFGNLFSKKDKKDLASVEPVITETLPTVEEKPSSEISTDASSKKTPHGNQGKKEEEPGTDFHLFSYSGEEFVPPPLSLLEGDRGKPDVGDIKASANIIKRTLQNFGIPVEMDEITIGPSITRYALKPAEGVRLSKIVALQRDLELSLAAHPIRIEAPIPGKSLVGIEVPNTAKATVGLASMFASEEFKESKKSLLGALGRNISGTPVFANISKMPHLLVAGATGSGKSVTIHALVTSLLFRNSPDTLRFIMVDPKRVELTVYNKIPHLLTPVITDAKKAILSLKWAAKEMERRYDVLESEKVRDIDSYHKNILLPAIKKRKDGGKDTESDGKELPESMPYIVIIIDELADIMQTYPRELEAAIVRLAQMSRAVGIHLILSTQRPSVNIITGLIKANIPARVALQVASQIDSRTILDMAGAEKLLGAGDMLYLSGEMSQPTRIQCPFISESELKRVVSYLVEKNANRIPDEIIIDNGSMSSESSIFGINIGDENDVDDDLYEEARIVVIEAGKASTSYLQRKLRVGYARAARIIDILEERGVVGPADGSKAREVITPRPNQSGVAEGFGENE
ncbi:MAG: DNA translocase FtsK 4TM domain-containing protein [Patescibacteria group bacterium]